MCVSVSVSVCVLKRKRERERPTETDRQTGRQSMERLYTDVIYLLKVLEGGQICRHNISGNRENAKDMNDRAQTVALGKLSIRYSQITNHTPTELV